MTASTMVKVWNRNKYPHEERFKGEIVKIPPGGFVEMEYLDGVDFQGQFTGMPPKDHPQPERFHKMIVVEKPGQPLFRDDEAKVKLENEPKGQADVVLAEPKAAGTDPKVAALEAELAQLRAMIQGQAERKKPGPKPKAKKA